MLRVDTVDMSHFTVDDMPENVADDFYVKLDDASDEWKPVDGDMMTIPVVPDDRVSAWSKRRLGLLDVEYHGLSTSPVVSVDGFMNGKACVPDSMEQCDICGCQKLKKVESVTMTLRTYRGAVRRKVFEVHCENCSHVYKWNPASECILTIRGGREGGMIKKCFGCVVTQVSKQFVLKQFLVLCSLFVCGMHVVRLQWQLVGSTYMTIWVTFLVLLEPTLALECISGTTRRIWIL